MIGERNMASRRKRSGGRAGNHRNSSSSINQMPWQQVVNIDDPIEPLSEDGIQNIHEKMSVLVAIFWQKC